jgi:hypothetical protein
MIIALLARAADLRSLLELFAAAEVSPAIRAQLPKPRPLAVTSEDSSLADAVSTSDSRWLMSVLVVVEFVEAAVLVAVDAGAATFARGHGGEGDGGFRDYLSGEA